MNVNAEQDRSVLARNIALLDLVNVGQTQIVRENQTSVLLEYVVVARAPHVLEPKHVLRKVVEHVND